MWASIKGTFVKIQMWYLHTSNIHTLNYCHIVTELTTCISFLMQVCI